MFRQFRGILRPKIGCHQKKKVIPQKSELQQSLNPAGLFHSEGQGSKNGISRQPHSKIREWSRKITERVAEN